MPESQRKLPTEQEIFDLCDIFADTMISQPTVIHRSGKIVIVGDIHGNAFDLMRIFNKFGFPPQTRYLFLGDYVDRGSSSVEVLIMLFSLKLIYPNHIDLLRGNHETPSMSEKYGFKAECNRKLSDLAFTKFMDALQELPFACVINDELFCIHGGLSPLIETINDIEAETKPQEICESELLCDLVWSDPRANVRNELFVPSIRGSGHFFSQEATVNFLKRNNLRMIIRSHEQCNDGYEYPFQKQVLITIFSTTGYSGLSNTAGFLTTRPGLKPTIDLMEFAEPNDANRKLLKMPDPNAKVYEDL